MNTKQQSPMTTLSLSLALLAGLVSSAGQASPDGEFGGTGPHNVIVLLADDVGKDMINAYMEGVEDYPDAEYPNTTPALDALANSGILFNYVWTSPLCSPTRAQILTGRQTRHHGLGEAIGFENPGSGTLALGIATLPTILRNAPIPYDTALTGKWHVSDITDPIDHPLGTQAVPWFNRMGGSLFNLHYEDGGYNHWTKTFATAMDESVDECAPAPCQAIAHEYASADTVNDAIHLMDEMSEPFFLQVAFNAVHWPLEAPEGGLEAASCAFVQTDPLCESTFDDSDRPRDTRCMVQWLDNEIGRFMCALDEDRLARPTTIIFMSDNGGRGDASVAPFDPGHGKGTVYEGGVNVPFIVRSPLIPAHLEGTTSDALIMAQDLMATTAQLAETNLPPDPAGLVDSISMLPYLSGETTSQRQHVYAERFRPNFTPDENGNPPANYNPSRHDQAALDDAGFKLIHKTLRTGDLVDVTEKFYDLNNDPYEQNNLMNQIDQAPYAAAYTALRETLDLQYPNLMNLIDDDQDNVINSADNCLAEQNADQRDTNGDGYGNICDADLDDNCIVNYQDFLIMRSVQNTNDPDADLDGNGIVNFDDIQRLMAALGSEPGPSGVATSCN